MKLHASVVNHCIVPLAEESIFRILTLSFAVVTQLVGLNPTRDLIANVCKASSQGKGIIKMELKENNIEFITGTGTMTVTFSNRKHITRVKKLYAQRGAEFLRYFENPDGSICATLPLSWLKINPGAKPDPAKPKRQMSDEQKAKLLDALARGRAARKNK